MPAYLVYKAADGSEAAMFPSDSPQREVLSRTVDDVPMELVAEFWAPRWRSAVKAYNAILDDL